MKPTARTEEKMNRPRPTYQRRARSLALFLLLTMLIPAANAWQPAHADTYFPQTGYSAWGPFEQYWQAHGGLEQFGLPRTSVYPAGGSYDAQWFERALFTYNPTKPDPYKVELYLLGSMLTEGRRAEAPFVRAKPAAEGTFFEATGHNLTGKFLQHWQATGGLAIYGYPVSEAFTEKSKSDGKTYLVQYFERNRFEHHAEAAGTKWEVQLGLLGSELLDAQGGPQAIARLGAGKYYPRPAGGIHVPPGDIVDSPNAGTPEPVDDSIPPAPALPANSRTVLFSTDFSSPDLGAWQPGNAYSPPDASPASWSVNGVLHQSVEAGEEGASIDALLLTKNNVAADVTLEAQLLPGGGEPLGLVVRWTNDGYYAVKLYARSDNTEPKAHIVKVTPKGEYILARSQTWPGYTARQWHAVSFTAKGNSLWVEVNGQRIVEATDSQLTSGKFGLYAYADGRAYFDNVRATMP
jgi:hypothetical protein